MLDNLLDRLNLDHKEKIIYKVILERGKVAPAVISQLTHINRTTVYSVAKELKEKGLIMEDLGGKTIYYLPSQKEDLEKIIKLEKEKSEQRIITIQKLQTELSLFPQSKTYSVPKIRFIDGADIKDYLYRATPKWDASILATDTTWWGFQDHTFVEEFKDWIVWYWKQAAQEIDLKLFSNDKAIEEQMVKEKLDRRMIRFWIGEEEFTATQWVIGSYIIFIMTNQKPYYLVEIHDSVIAHNMRTLFKRMWKDTN